MKNGWIVERAEPGRGAQIADLIRRSLPARLRPLTIWESPRSGMYVDSLLAGALPDQDHDFYLLRRNHCTAGLAALRRWNGAAFLNHLYVSAPFQRRGLGAVLLHSALEDYLVRHRLRRLSLDVFSGAGAESWYHRLGLREEEERGWWLGEPAARSGDRAPGEAAAAGWGFSTFVLYTAGGSRYEIGSLYTPYFRLTDARAAFDRQLHRALARIDAGRRLLLIATDTPPATWTQVAASRRLACDAVPLLAALASKTRKAHAA